MVVGYATKMVRDDKKDRATIIVILGVPITLSIGIPLGTSIGQLIGRLTIRETIHSHVPFFLYTKSLYSLDQRKYRL